MSQASLLDLPPAPKSPSVPAPMRRPDAIRRTSSIDVCWPDGQGETAMMAGRARDFANGQTLTDGRFDARINPQREIVEIGPDSRLFALIGQRAGSGLRAAVADALPDEARDGSALHLLLDDISGANLVSNWAWSLWEENWIERLEAMKRDPDFSTNFARENVCSGLRTGSSGLSLAAGSVDTGDVRNIEESDGWHAFPSMPSHSFRRARRIDVWRERAIHIDAHFQDSAETPAGGRAAVHEYRLSATADAKTLEILTLNAEPRILPFPECPAAGENAKRLIGTPLPELRAQVLAQLKGPAGCTHLNDALRALADVPALVRALSESISRTGG